MLVRAVTPPTAYGLVFGFVSTGFNIGASIAPIVYGMLMDHGQPRMVFSLVRRRQHPLRVDRDVRIFQARDALKRRHGIAARSRLSPQSNFAALPPRRRHVMVKTILS